MDSAYLLENGVDKFLLEDGSGVLLLEAFFADIVGSASITALATGDGALADVIAGSAAIVVTTTLSASILGPSVAVPAPTIFAASASFAF